MHTITATRLARFGAAALCMVGLIAGCLPEAPRTAPADVGELAPSAPRMLTTFDPAVPHGRALDGQTVVLPEGSEVLAAAERAAETATVDRVLASFRWDALPFLGPDVRLMSAVVLDPGLVAEESGAATPGLCYNASHTVVLNRNLWRAYGDAEREIVLYHELGHCELGRRHTKGRRPDGGPVSLMNQNTVADVSYYLADRPFYVEELFTTRQAPPHFRIGPVSAGAAASAAALQRLLRAGTADGAALPAGR